MVVCNLVRKVRLLRWRPHQVAWPLPGSKTTGRSSHSMLRSLISTSGVMTSSTLSSLLLQRSPISPSSLSIRKPLLQTIQIYSSQRLQWTPIASRPMYWKKLIPINWTSKLRSDCVSLATEKRSQVLISKTMPSKMQRCNLASRRSQVRLRSQAIWCLAQVKLSMPTTNPVDLTHRRWRTTHSSWWTTHSRWQIMLKTFLRASTAKFQQQEAHIWTIEWPTHT